MKSPLLLGLILLFLIGYVGAVYLLFQKPKSTDEYPILRSRFGNIMWHSEDADGVFQGNLTGNSHLYCYYPKAKALYSDKSGEYIIKRAEKITECDNFYGLVSLQEDYWVSEKEKIWWSKDQHDSDNLAATEKPLESI